MRASTDPAIAANRYGLGARPGDLTVIGRDPLHWLDAQLSGAPPVIQDASLRSSADILARALEIRRERRDERRAARNDGAALADALKLGEFYRPIYVAEATARLDAAVVSERPFVERLTHFWTNHFAVSVD